MWVRHMGPNNKVSLSNIAAIACILRSYLAQIARLRIDHLRFFALDRSDLKVGILLQDLVPVQIIEGSRCVSAGNLLEHGLAARVGVNEVGQVIDWLLSVRAERRIQAPRTFGINNAPQALLCIVLSDFVARDLLGHAEPFGPAPFQPCLRLGGLSDIQRRCNDNCFLSQLHQ
jgi:hypothetical protein